jgi:hypothetical protein
VSAQRPLSEILTHWCNLASVAAYLAPLFSCAFAIALAQHLHLVAVIIYGALATLMIGTLINSLVNVFLAALAALKEEKS